MQLRRYQWVGLLAGFPLFSGAWLSAYSSNAWWGALGLGLTAVALWAAIRVETRSTMQQHLTYGLSAGILAGLVARLSGLVASGWAFDKWQAVSPSDKYVFFPDLFKNVLNGGFWASVGILLLCAALGAAVSMFEPERTEPERKSTTSKSNSTRRRTRRA